MGMKEIEQLNLFDVDPDWKKDWKGMPEYNQEDLMPWKTIKVHFRNLEDRQAFSDLVKQRITDLTQYIWFPKEEIVRVVGQKAYASKEQVLPRYPVYIISKGRWESRLTAKALEAVGVPYRIVIEPQEYENYAAVISKENIRVLPFSNLGQGSIPARNWVWDDAAKEGWVRHWILDDNIDGFYRLNNNLKVPVTNGNTFRAIEDFADRYTNVALCGMNYIFFTKRKQLIPPFILNTRIYSCILIKNDIPYRWRGRYNEDTDLSLRALKDGWCTVLFNTFSCAKQQTMTMKGGNTDELYQGDGRKQMAESLYEQHPDCVIITEKFGHTQHHVNYHIFKHNKLILKPGVVLPEGTDEFGMEFQEVA